LISFAIAGQGQEQRRLASIGYLLRSLAFCRCLLRRGCFLRKAAFQGGH
jgi:hypothetical protein